MKVIPWDVSGTDRDVYCVVIRHRSGTKQTYLFGPRKQAEEEIVRLRRKSIRLVSSNPSASRAASRAGSP
jgi:hypothetical protein